VVAVRVNNSAGSAVVISRNGLVLCAAHVCEEPNLDVEFTFPDGRTANGHTLGTYHGIDAGLMQISDPGPWPSVEVAHPQDIRAGDWVLALGYPGAFDPERSLVARLGRILRRSALLQTDCTLLAGDSGGPLFDLQGRVVGIHSRISDSLAGNFHVPVAVYLDSWERLAKGDNWGESRSSARSSVGVRGVDHPEGCRLELVYEDGPGFKAGLKPGDIVLKVNGEKVEDSETFAQSVRAIHPGSEAVFEIMRGGKTLSLKVQVEARRWRGGRWRPTP
jgi:serine protease Do